jgi:hypothetical protein
MCRAWSSDEICIGFVKALVEQSGVKHDSVAGASQNVLTFELVGVMLVTSKKPLSALPFGLIRVCIRYYGESFEICIVVAKIDRHR